MEYLMTYGWAILIIAVVLGALFQLGVFSGIGVPRAQPGNCQVIKAGSGISQVVSLEGQCQGQLPQYVAQFNGQSSAVSLSTSIAPTGAAPRTLTAWVSTTSNTNQNILGYGGNQACNSGFQIDTNLTCYVNGAKIGVVMDPGCGYACSFPASATPNTWYFVAVTYDGATATIYLSSPGGQLISGNLGYSANTNLVSGFNIGHGYGYHVTSSYFSGSIANVQLYNASLTSSEVRALYLEGIGGAPINPQYIVGWWPLNGNAQDYSGNNNNGQPTSITYSSSWTNGYTQP